MKPIEIDGVSKLFGAVTALSDVTFGCERGTVTGLVGHNGAGKSTIINLLAGLLRPERGGVRVFGQDPAAASSTAAIMRKTGFLLEEDALFEYLTGGEFLRFVGHAFGLTQQEGARRTERLGAFMDLLNDLDRLVDHYSTGMRKKLAIAAALLPGPGVLVLDEPFETLDPLMVRRLTRELRRFAAHGGTVLLSSHLLQAVERVCDTVIFLDHGKVVGERRGTAEQSAVSSRGVPEALDATYAEVIKEEPVESPDWLTVEGGEARTGP